MRDVMEVLRDKESQLERLGKEIKVLRVAARIISEEGGEGAPVEFNPDLGKASEAVSASDNGQNKSRWP
jgi:hypothetical protein